MTGHNTILVALETAPIIFRVVTVVSEDLEVTMLKKR